MKNRIFRKLIVSLVTVVFALTLLGGIVINPVGAVVVSVKQEAEKAKLEGGILKGTKYAGHSGTGYAFYPTGNTKAKVTFTLNNTKKMSLDITIRYSNGNKTTKGIVLYRNGVALKTVYLPSTGLFSKWKTTIRTISFNAGKSTISFKSKDKVSAAIDYISCLPATNYTVAVDLLTKYQTIDGFGGFGGNGQSGTFYNQKFIDDCYDDLGATIYRGEVETDFQLSNDGSSVDTISPSSFNKNGGFKKWLNYFQAVKAKGPSKIFVTTWSPPAWMKSNGSVKDGGNLLPQYYQHYAKYCAAYVKYMEEGGVDIYAFSIQNEPNFVEPYQSCVYTPETYAKVNAIVAARFKKEGISAKLLGPEDVRDLGRIAGYIFGLDQAGKMDSMDIFAVHGYGDDGVNPGSDTDFWNSTYALARDFNKPLWMTETSGYTTVWSSCLTLGENINEALSSGRINAWIWWRLSDTLVPRNEMEGLMKNLVPTKKYYVSKNFYRYIRPGAVRYFTSSAFSDLSVTAYLHPTDKKMTFVIVNEANVSRNVTLGALNGGKIPAQFNAYRTSETENCVSIGSVNSSLVVIPASSITTLQASY